MSIDWQTRVNKIQSEIDANQKRTQELREAIRPIKQEIATLKTLGEKEEMKAKAEELAPLDKEFNKLRSDFYFLNAELTEAKKQLGAQ